MAKWLRGSIIVNVWEWECVAGAAAISSISFIHIIYWNCCKILQTINFELSDQQFRLISATEGWEVGFRSAFHFLRLNTKYKYRNRKKNNFGKLNQMWCISLMKHRITLMRNCSFVFTVQLKWLRFASMR